MVYKKGIIWGLIIAVVSLAMVLVGIFYWKNLRGVGPALRPPVGDIVKDLEGMPDPVDSTGSQPTPSATAGTAPQAENNTDFPLKLPDGFSISIFAKDLPGARVMEFDTFGNMWVSQTSQGAVSLLEVKDGKVVRQDVVLKNLKKPHGLAFHPEHKTLLYVAEEHRVSTIPTYSEGQLEKIIDLPSGAGHFTRTINFGPDKRLYVSIGSSCNVCAESDNRRAKIFSANDDGSNFQEFARGFRNAVFMTWHPKLKNMWVTEMGRDLLGDDLPPDEINVIPIKAETNSGLSVADQNPVQNFGWPNCYGKNIHDTEFDKNTYIRNPCMDPFEIPSYVDLQAHSAPLGLGFVPASWPAEYRDDLIVAYHGSWNRTKPTGYKLVRMKLDAQGNYLGMEDFITGWYVPGSGKGPEGALGRPVDVKFYNGALYVSDDKAGVIYKIEYKK
ncbi:MAG: PQQ-dependent sugar dehydrogenase [Candidatus Taylorbacteria bacterium]|nr:PQQ-dependent sugar dehydrogenase [Candidatus Taylorbacteria bacterium]